MIIPFPRHVPSNQIDVPRNFSSKSPSVTMFCYHIYFYFIVFLYLFSFCSLISIDITLAISHHPFLIHLQTISNFFFPILDKIFSSVFILSPLTLFLIWSDFSFL